MYYIYKLIEDVGSIPMTELGIPFVSQEKILASFKIFSSKLVEKKLSERGDTTKLLVELQDGHRVEVLF